MSAGVGKPSEPAPPGAVGRQWRPAYGSSGRGPVAISPRASELAPQDPGRVPPIPHGEVVKALIEREAMSWSYVATCGREVEAAGTGQAVGFPSLANLRESHHVTATGHWFLIWAWLIGTGVAGVAEVNPIEVNPVDTPIKPTTCVAMRPDEIELVTGCPPFDQSHPLIVRPVVVAYLRADSVTAAVPLAELCPGMLAILSKRHERCCGCLFLVNVDTLVPVFAYEHHKLLSVPRDRDRAGRTLIDSWHRVEYARIARVTVIDENTAESASPDREALLFSRPTTV